MKFDFMGIILMIVAIAVGQFLGTWFGTMLGAEFAGGIVGALLVGFCVYVVYTFITGAKLSFTGAVIFSVLIYIANIISAYIATMIGFEGGVLTLVITGIVASFLWGWVGGKQAKKAKLKSPVKL